MEYHCPRKQTYLERYALQDTLPEAICRALQLKDIARGQFLCRQQHPLTDFCLLVEGKLQVDCCQQDGRQTVFSFETPLSVIGDLELFERAPVMSNVQAITDAVVLRVPAWRISELGYREPQFLHFVIRHLGKKLYDSTHLMSQHSLSLEIRLAGYLFQRQHSDGLCFQLEKREALAAMLGCSVRHLNRSLSRYQVDGLLRFKNKTLEITAPDMLATILQQESV